MADRFYYGEFGATMKTEITEAAVDSAGADVSLRVTYDATNNSKQACLNAIDAIRQRLVEETWPVA